MLHLRVQDEFASVAATTLVNGNYIYSDEDWELLAHVPPFMQFNIKDTRVLFENLRRVAPLMDALDLAGFDMLQLIQARLLLYYDRCCMLKARLQ